MINVVIGYDEGEKVAFHVLSESIRKHASQPVAITPLCLNTIKEHFWRDKQDNQSTEFAFSRFIVPWLMGYKGWTIFMDCDMLFRDDIAKLWELRDFKYSVMCCKHDYEPKQGVKFRGAKNEKFPKKNWSSMMLMNNTLCTALTPEYVNSASGLELHQFKWLPNEDSCGTIPLEWNWLVGEYEYNNNAKNVHYTLGGPYFNDYKDCDYSKEWMEVWRQATKIGL
jgi:hypothetical protein